MSVIDLLTGDGGILLFTVVGIAATAVSIVRDTRGQQARSVPQQIPVEVELGARAA